MIAPGPEGGRKTRRRRDYPPMPFVLETRWSLFFPGLLECALRVEEAGKDGDGEGVVFHARSAPKAAERAAGWLEEAFGRGGWSLRHE